MSKVDFKKTYKSLYSAPSSHFVIVEVPRRQFFMVDGEGDPGKAHAYSHAVDWLHALSFAARTLSKSKLDRDYVVPPLEGIWWSEDMDTFAGGARDAWKWTMMIMAPDWITDEIVKMAVDKASQKRKEDRPVRFRFEPFDEGQCAQILHTGPYGAEGPLIERLHAEFLPEQHLSENGHHHEIYLTDPRRSPPEKWKTVLRQPVKPV